MNNSFKVFICIPTYREPQKVLKLLNSCSHIRYRPFQIVIVNANPGDKTSEIIKNKQNTIDYEITEIQGEPSEFWSATVNRGFKEILKLSKKEDWILLMNVDVEFNNDIVELLIKKAIEQGDCQISALSLSKKYVISSGVRVKSWLLSLTHHPYAGYKLDQVKPDELIPVDYLPTRCLLFPVKSINNSELIAEKLLPHYGADYEFTHRLSMNKYKPFIYTNVWVEVDTNNTGESVYSQEKNILQRVSNIMSIKNPSNPKFRVIFVLLVYPLYAIPTAIFFYLARTFLEVSLGGKKIRTLLNKKESGFS